MIKLQIMSVCVSFGLLRRVPFIEIIKKESIIKRLFMRIYNLTPLGLWPISIDTFLTLCNDAVADIHLHLYKRNCSITCYLSEA